MSWRDKIAAVLAGKVGGPTPTGIHVYHSSPHDFDRFDLSKIGTGEGAQVYGHGIYAAENPAVSGQGGQYWQQFLPRFEGAERFAADRLKGNNFDPGAALKVAADEVTYWKTKIASIGEQKDSGYYRDRAWAWQDDLKHAQDQLAKQEAAHGLLARGDAPIGPRTYEVNFKAKPEELLDWDKPVGQQPRIVDAFRQLGYKEAPRPYSDKLVADVGGFLDLRSSGEDAYRTAIRHAADRYGHTDRGTNARYASEMLGEAGIPGIRYLDEGSRNMYGLHQGMIDNYGSREAALANAQKRLASGMGDPEHYRSAVEALSKPPTHNYVAFDPSKLDIMAKYGVVGGVPLGAATMGGTIDQSSYGERQ